MANNAPNSSLKKEIRAAFTRAGLNRIDKDVLGKCVSLASTLQITPEVMATCWEAFSLTKKVSELSSHTFEAYKNQVHKHSEVAPLSTVSSSDTAVRSRNVKRKASMVTPVEPKRQALTPNSKSPTSSVDKVAISFSDSPQAACRPATQLPRYEERDKVGEVAASLNPKNWPASKQRSGSSELRCNIRTEEFASSNITKPYRHMFTAISDRSKALEKHLLSMSQKIIETYGIGDGENGIAPLEQVNIPRQDPVCCVGRICNEAHSGRLNATSVVLEGSSAACGGARINVDLSEMKSNKKSFSLFPGQIVAIEGMNPTGRKLMARRIFEGAAYETNTSTVGELRKLHHEKQDGSPLNVLTACGPFTTSDSMDYQPFNDLIHIVVEKSPDVVILTGPFVDMRQDTVKSGRTFTEIEDEEGNGVDRVVPYETFFAARISIIIEELVESGEISNTQFVLVPSLDDATAKWVYPQPPLQDRLSQPLVSPAPFDVGTMGIGRINEHRKEPLVHCLSNPCTFKINDVVFGVTSTDVVFHLSKEETNCCLEPGSRLRRLAQHMLQQRSYYPLFPPPSNFPANLDLKRMENWQMPCNPDILIAPSCLTCFASSVLDSTVFINPGQLTRGTTGGTYAIMDIHPMKRETLDESGGDDVQVPHGLPERINVEIKRI